MATEEEIFEAFLAANGIGEPAVDFRTQTLTYAAFEDSLTREDLLASRQFRAFLDGYNRRPPSVDPTLETRGRARFRQIIAEHALEDPGESLADLTNRADCPVLLTPAERDAMTYMDQYRLGCASR